MTAPDRPVQDVIAEAIWTASRADEGSISYAGANIVAATVVAACRGATVAQQAELVQGWVEHSEEPEFAIFTDCIRVVGPWWEDPS